MLRNIFNSDLQVYSEGSEVETTEAPLSDTSKPMPRAFLIGVPVALLGFGLVAFVLLGRNDTDPVPFEDPEPDIQQMIEFSQALTPLSGQRSVLGDMEERIRSVGYALTSEQDLDGNPGNRVQSWDKDGFNIQLGTCTKSDYLVSRVSFHANSGRRPLPDEFTARVQAQMEDVDLILFDDGNPARIDQVSLISPTL